MNKREAAIVSCYTGYLIGDLGDIYKYLSDFLGRPVFTHEIPGVMDMYKEQIKKDFVSIEVVE